MLVTGAAGMLGRDLTALLRVNHRVVAADLEDFDITGRRATVDAVKASQAPAVVHCAAYTDVDGAETDSERALAVNAAGAANVAAGCRETGARLYLISTDFVFDGGKGAPYVESDQPNPSSAYGRSKLEGERLAREELSEKLTVVRTAWLYGAYGEHFLTRLVRLVRGRDRLCVVDDQVGSPTWTGELAACLVRMLDAGADGPLYHAAGGGSCTRFEWAKAWFSLAGLEHVRLEPVGSDKFPAPARRPVSSALASERLERDGITPPARWRDGLEAYARAGGLEKVKKILDG